MSGSRLQSDAEAAGPVPGDVPPRDTDAAPRFKPRALAAFLLIPVIAVADVLTGTQMAMSDFYLVCVILDGVRRARNRPGGRGCLRVGRVRRGPAPQRTLPALRVELLLPLDPRVASATAAVYGAGGVFVERLQRSLHAQRQLVDDLRRAAATIRTLQGFLPICAWCKRMRDGDSPGEWKPVEQYVTEHTDAAFTHGSCPECAARMRAGGPR